MLPLDHHIDLALDQLVQTGRLAEADGHLRLSSAELRQRRSQAIDIETRMHPDVQQARDPLRLEFSGHLGEAPKRLTYRSEISFSSRNQDHLACQPLEQLHSEPLLQQADLLADGTGRDVQLVRGLLEAEMAGRRLEGAQGVQRWQQIGHGEFRRSGGRVHEFRSRDKGEILLCRR
jgi:hypothetical protein